MTTLAELKKMSKMDDAQLDNVAGGTRTETVEDCKELIRRKIWPEGVPLDVFMHSLGYTGYKSNSLKKDSQGNLIADETTPNVYVNKQGQKISREEFWKNFDKENNLK